MRRPRLVIMLKEPVAGRVKTRLGRDLGMTTAAWWFRHQSNDLIRRMARDPRWETILAVAPDRAVMSRFWPVYIRKMAQRSGNLGQRMQHILMKAGSGPVIIIGADIPRITTGQIANAFAKLMSNDMVFGPAPDGGFWLVGAAKRSKPLPKTLFNAVRWSSKHALSDTLKSTGAARVAMINMLQDVDTINDLRHQ